MKAQQENQSNGTEMVSGMNGLDSLEQARGKFATTGGMSADATKPEGRAADSPGSSQQSGSSQQQSSSQQSGSWQEMMKTSWQSLSEGVTNLSEGVTNNASWQKLSDGVKSASPTSLAIGAVAAAGAVGAAMWLGRKQWVTPSPSASGARSSKSSASTGKSSRQSGKGASHRSSHNTLEQ